MALLLGRKRCFMVALLLRRKALLLCQLRCTESLGFGYVGIQHHGEPGKGVAL